jgi:hypothetical protein
LELSAGRRQWTMWAAGMTRNSYRLAVNLTKTTWASNSKSPPAAFSIRTLTRKPPGTTRQLGLPYVLARPNRLRPRASDFSPRAGSRQPRLTDCSTAAAPPPRPRGRGDYQPARPGRPEGPNAGLGTMPHHPGWRGQLNPQAARLRHEPLG